MDHLERLQSLTRNYRFLGGWQMGLVGVLYLLWGFCILLWGPLARDLFHGWLLLPSMTLLSIGLYFAQSHQQRKLGMVKASLSRRALVEILTVCVFYVVFVRLSGPDFKFLFKAPIEPTLFNAGVILNLMGLLPSFPWRHYLAFGIPLMGIAFLPMTGLVPLEQFYRGWTYVIVGTALLLCGVIDRWILARGFAALQLQENHV